MLACSRFSVSGALGVDGQQASPFLFLSHTPSSPARFIDRLHWLKAYNRLHWRGQLSLLLFFSLYWPFSLIFNDDNRDSQADIYNIVISLQNVWTNQPNSGLYIHLLEEIFHRSCWEVSWSVSSLGWWWSARQLLVCKRSLTFLALRQTNNFYQCRCTRWYSLHMLMINFWCPRNGRQSNDNNPHLLINKSDSVKKKQHSYV